MRFFINHGDTILPDLLSIEKICSEKGRILKNQVSEAPYLFEQGEDPILLSDELDIDLFTEFPEIETENENLQPTEEEETH